MNQNNCKQEYTTVEKKYIKVLFVVGVRTIVTTDYLIKMLRDINSYLHSFTIFTIAQVSRRTIFGQNLQISFQPEMTP